MTSRAFGTDGKASASALDGELQALVGTDEPIAEDDHVLGDAEGRTWRSSSGRTARRDAVRDHAHSARVDAVSVAQQPLAPPAHHDQASRCPCELSKDTLLLRRRDRSVRCAGSSPRAGCRPPARRPGRRRLRSHRTVRTRAGARPPRCQRSSASAGSSWSSGPVWSDAMHRPPPGNRSDRRVSPGRGPRRTPDRPTNPAGHVVGHG